MTREDIIRQMSDAGLKAPAKGDFIFIHWDQIALLLSHEREACAKVCADLYKQWEDDLANVAVGEDDPEIPNWFDCKLAIEARSET